jgi:phage shock protein E
MERYIIPGIIFVVIVTFFIYLKITSSQKKKNVIAKLAEGAKVFDVRSPSEFSGGHFEGAVNVPVDKIGSKLAMVGPMDKPVIVYCASGHRSTKAAGILKRAGYLDVTNAGSYANMPK